jgi:hypothetical protein
MTAPLVAGAHIGYVRGSYTAAGLARMVGQFSRSLEISAVTLSANDLHVGPFASSRAATADLCKQNRVEPQLEYIAD